MHLLYKHIFGPVPSRRLGLSLGIDLVPFKTCTYDCIYCQLGRTTDKTVERREYVPVKDVLNELRLKLSEGVIPDYLTLSGSGEPTLHSGLDELITGIKQITRIPVVVLTNGSLLWDSAVQRGIAEADIVIPSLDAGDETLFHYVNRPHPDISFFKMIEGLSAFRKDFKNQIWLEVFLLGGVTGIKSEVRKIAGIADKLSPDKIQLNTVARPPAEDYALPLSTDQMNGFKNMFHGNVDVIGHSKPKTPHVSNVASGEILSLLDRRPCTSADVANGLGIHPAEAIKNLEALLADGNIKTIISNGVTFYCVNQPKGEKE